MSKTEPLSGVTNARPQVSTVANGPNNSGSFQSFQQPSPVVPSQQNGVRTFDSVHQGNENYAILSLIPLNGTFERKQINVPYQPGILKVGRQTNAKTVPTSMNGYFDSKVLSRAHAEVWADRNGKIWIRDVKSSNGTFINGHRLSGENKDSEPHEMRENDTLELGIDIISEDHKSIVHHKVSAKVEFAGFPLPSNGVFDMPFQDMDPSQGGSILNSPLSQQMARGRPVAAYNRSVSSSMSTGSHINALTQQRQMSSWGVLTGMDNLVRFLSNEMRTAKEQAQDLDQTNSFLKSLLADDKKDEKQSSEKDEASSRLPNGRPKLSRIDSVSRFSEPPAPPPRQPLPDKPELGSSRSSPLETTLPSPLKRSDTAKPGAGLGTSPTGINSSQILSLVDALTMAKTELESQGARVKELEDMLHQERAARQSAEERARKIEKSSTFKPGSVAIPEDSVAESDIGLILQTKEENRASETKSLKNGDLDNTKSSTDDLQSRLDEMMVEMKKMKEDMHKFRQRAEVAETDASSARVSLADMIEQLRQRNEEAPQDEQDNKPSSSLSDDLGTIKQPWLRNKSPRANQSTNLKAGMDNGHVKGPKLPEHLERAMTTLLRTDPDGQLLAQSAPFASMLGVVLIGVGLMAYLNNWQKVER